MAFAQRPTRLWARTRYTWSSAKSYMCISFIRGRKIQFVLKCVLLINLNFKCVSNLKRNLCIICQWRRMIGIHRWHVGSPIKTYIVILQGFTFTNSASQVSLPHVSHVAPCLCRLLKSLRYAWTAHKKICLLIAQPITCQFPFWCTTRLKWRQQRARRCVGCALRPKVSRARCICWNYLGIAVFPWRICFRICGASALEKWSALLLTMAF